MLGKLTVEELIKLTYNLYDTQIAVLNKENEELRLYKELVNKAITDKELEQENVALRHRVRDLEKEVKSWRENGAPF